MKKYLYVFTSAVALLSSSQLQAGKIKLGFTPKGSIYQVTDNKDFISGTGQLYDLSGQSVEKWDVISGKSYNGLLIHPDEMSLVSIDESGHLVRLERQKLSQPHYGGQVLFPSSCCSHLKSLTYTPKGEQLFVAQVYPEGKYLTIKEMAQNSEILNTIMTRIGEISQKKCTLLEQQFNLRQEQTIGNIKHAEISLKQYSECLKVSEVFKSKKLEILDDDPLRDEKIKQLDLEEEKEIGLIQVQSNNVRVLSMVESVERGDKLKGLELQLKDLDEESNLNQARTKEMSVADPTPFTEIHCIDPQDGTHFETFSRLPHILEYQRSKVREKLVEVIKSAL